MAGPRGAPPAVGIAMDDPPPEYSVAAHLPTYDQAELSKGTLPTYLLSRYKKQGSGSGWIRIQIARLDPDPYSESGS